MLFRALRPPCLRGILLSAAIMGSMVQVKYTGLVFAMVWGIFLAVDSAAEVRLARCLRWSARWPARLLAAAGPALVRLRVLWAREIRSILTCTAGFPRPIGSTTSRFSRSSRRLQAAARHRRRRRVSLAGHLPHRQFRGRIRRISGFLGARLAALLVLAWLARKSSGKACHAATGCPHEDSRRDAFRTGWLRRRRLPYWDMAIVSVAMIAGIVAYTPYVRYWLPAYPLVGRLRRAGGRIVGSCDPLAAGGAMACRSLAGPPWRCCCACRRRFSSVNVPWDAYAKRISAERVSGADRFRDYEAAQQLNTILGRDDGVLCTGCDGVYLVGGRPYDFECWWNNIHHIHDSPVVRRVLPPLRHPLLDGQFASPAAGLSATRHRGEYWTMRGW